MQLENLIQCVDWISFLGSVDFLSVGEADMHIVTASHAHVYLQNYLDIPAIVWMGFILRFEQK